MKSWNFWLYFYDARIPGWELVLSALMKAVLLALLIFAADPGRPSFSSALGVLVVLFFICLLPRLTFIGFSGVFYFSQGYGWLEYSIFLLGVLGVVCAGFRNIGYRLNLYVFRFIISLTALYFMLKISAYR